MINTNATINESVKVYFKSTPAITDITDIQVINNGTVLLTPNITIVETDVPGIYTVTYTPNVTGRTLIIFQNEVIAYVEVVSRSVYSFLRNIEDEAVGSWTWDKQLGKLQLIRQDGTSLADFDVSDSNIAASRERTS